MNKLDSMWAFAQRHPFIFFLMVDTVATCAVNGIGYVTNAFRPKKTIVKQVVSGVTEGAKELAEAAVTK